MPRKHRRRSWGSITEVVKGKKHVLRWMENTPHGRKRMCETFYGTYREASARLDAIHVERFDDAIVPTFGDVVRMWYMPWLDGRVRDGRTKESTRDGYVDILKRIVLPRFGDAPIDSIRPLDIQKWLSSLTKGNAKVAIVVARKAVDLAVNRADSEKATWIDMRGTVHPSVLRFGKGRGIAGGQAVRG